jgi:hypothetical protein
VNDGNDNLGFLRQHKGFGFEPGPFDELDYDLAPFAAEAAAEGVTKGEQIWENPVRLDQGAEGACVGFGWTGFLNAAPTTHTFEDEYAFGLYHTVTENDEYPGDWRTGQSGTSVRSGAKEVQRRGFIESYAFTYDVEEMALWLLNKGPLVIGVRWLTGMDGPSPDNGYYALVRGPQRGRHCVVVDQVHWGLGDRNWFGFANSWGTRYGDQGRAYFSEKGLRILMSDPNAVACTTVEPL